MLVMSASGQLQPEWYWTWPQPSVYDWPTRTWMAGPSSGPSAHDLAGAVPATRKNTAQVNTIQFRATLFTLL